MLRSDDSVRRDAGWDLRSGPANYAALLVWQVVTSICSFGAIWLGTHMLGPTRYGGIVALIAASQAIQQITIEWNSVAVFRYGCEEFVETGRIARTFWTRVMVTAPYVAAILISAHWWLPPVGRLLHLPSDLYPLVLLLFSVNLLDVHFQYSLRAAKLPRMQAMFAAVERLVILGCVIAAWFTTRSVMGVAFAYIAGPVTAIALAAFCLRRLIFPVAGFDRALFRRMLTFSMPLIPAMLMGYFSTNYLDAFFIARYMTPADMTFYAVAFQLAGTAMQLPVLTSSLLLPLFITLQLEGRQAKVETYVTSILPTISLGWSIVCGLGAAISALLIPIVFGARYAAAAQLMWPLLAAAALAGPIMMGYGSLANSLSATYMAAIATMATALANVILDIVLIPKFGLVGCAWATTAAYCCSLLSWSVLIKRKTGLPVTRSILACLPALAGAAWFSYAGHHAAATIALSVAGMVVCLLLMPAIKTSTAVLARRRAIGAMQQ